MDREASKSPPPHAIDNIASPALDTLAFRSKDSSDFLPLRNNQGVLHVALGLNPSQNGNRLLSPANLRQPTRGSRKKRKTAKQNNARHELDSPGSAEGGRRARDELAAVANEVHDQNAELDGQLLDDDDAPSLVLFCNLGQVDGDLGGGDADTDAVEAAADDQLGAAVR